ncbi:MAG: SLOG family protein [Candidatus Ornithomonoglobus sp.]
MVVTFCGHGKEKYNDDIKKRLYSTVEMLINQGAEEFLLGGYGAFDLLAAHTVKGLKEKYPHIKSVLAVPYINRDFNTDLYDGSEYPPIENVPKRFAILKRNEWMVNRADAVVAYIAHGWGGAAKSLEYAASKNKYIINLFC